VPARRRSPTTAVTAPDVLGNGETLLGAVSRRDYNAAEQQYSRLLSDRLEQLLRGQRNDLLLLRRYHYDPNRLGIMPTPRGIDRRRLRIAMAEEMAMHLMAFLADSTVGGPAAQQSDPDGRLTEIRQFPTRYPHIVIQRTDAYPDAGQPAPDWTEWRAERVQNQRTSTLVNRMLDAANLGVEIAKFVRR
jgi:hypothetical protein